MQRLRRHGLIIFVMVLAVWVVLKGAQANVVLGLKLSEQEKKDLVAFMLAF